MKWLAGLAQVLLVSLLVYVGSTITGAIDTVGKKVDGVLASLGRISEEQAVQKRDIAQMAVRQDRTENKVEVIELTIPRVLLRLEQLEKEADRGRR